MRYSWWAYIRDIIRQYPARQGKALEGVEKREYEAVQAAVDATERMEDGVARMSIIRNVHWFRTYTLEGAALAVPCSRRAATYWQRQFFEMVARERDLPIKVCAFDTNFSGTI